MGAEKEGRAGYACQSYRSFPYTRGSSGSWREDFMPQSLVRKIVLGAIVGTWKPRFRLKRVNQRWYRKGRRCDACREVQQHWLCLVEVADNGFVHQCGRWEDFGDDEEIEIYKLCQICFLQVQGLLDGDLIWQLEE